MQAWAGFTAVRQRIANKSRLLVGDEAEGNIDEKVRQPSDNAPQQAVPQTLPSSEASTNEDLSI